MSTAFDGMLRGIKEVLDRGLDVPGTLEIWAAMQGPPLPEDLLGSMRLYSETLPKALEHPFTPEQRCLHFLWDALDRLPLGLMVPFSIPFRRLLAGRLFKRCGTAFLAEENVRFNFGQFLEAGDGVFCNRGVFLDTKGGVRLGTGVALAEDVRIFTHTHSESSHIERTYLPVVVEDYAKIYAGATILPGVTIGREAIVAAGAMVTQNVPMNAVVAGVPARVIRQRQTDGRHGDSLDHIWLY